MNASEIPIVVGPPRSDDRATARRETLRLILRSRTFLVGAIVLLIWVFCAIFGNSIVPYDPYKDNLLDKLQPPSSEHWMGTDRLGRDVFSRLIVGARDILVVAPLATLLGTILGTAIGLMTGYFGGWFDDVVSRFIDAILAVPVIIIALVAITAVGTSTKVVIITIALIFAPIIARTVRAAVLSERDLDYVQAAALRNESTLYVMFVEILPNVLPPIMVEFTVRVGYAVFTVASLSFLGFGIQPPSADWGLTIFENYTNLPGGYWWPVLFPAIAIATLVVSINLIADGIAGALRR